MMKRSWVVFALSLMLGAAGACEDDDWPKADASTGAGGDAAADLVPDVIRDVLPDSAPDSAPDTAADRADDRPPLPGVTCVVKQRVVGAGGCSQQTTTETDVAFWLILVNLESHPESGLTTDSPGILLYHQRDGSYSPPFIATDMTFTMYRSLVTVPGMDTGTGRRTGDRIEFTMNAARTDDMVGCTLPVVEVTCSGSGWLQPRR